MKAQWILWMGYSWKWKLVVLVISLFLSGVQGQCPANFVDIDPPTERCVHVSTSTAKDFAEARWFCQNEDPRADLITITSSDLSNIRVVPAFSTTMNYYVGLTDASIPTAMEWVIDCKAYNGLMQPFVQEGTCPALATCNCYNLLNTDLYEFDCTAATLPYICALSQPEDFPELVCPTDWIGIKDRCYRYYTNSNPLTDFDGAEAICQAGGGNLARANFYDCNFAQLLSNRPDPDLTYLVGLRQDASNIPAWRDGSVPDLLIAAGFGECFQLADDSLPGSLQRTDCTIPIPNFICERDSILPTTEGIITTDDAATTVIVVTTGDTATTGEGVVTTGEGVATTGEGAVTTGEGAATTNIVVTTGDGTTDMTTERGLCCPFGSTEIFERCFSVMETEVQYINAIQTCVDFGGVIARVDPATEVNQFLVDYFTSSTVTKSVWIGLTRTQAQSPATEDTYSWHSDRSLLIPSEAFWSVGQPLGAVGINCVLAVNSNGREGQWFLANCAVLAYPLCQFERTFECTEDPCLTQPCDNTIGAITCASPGFGVVECICETGFQLSSTFGPCIDTNECVIGTPCDTATQNCLNNDGSFTCVCLNGLVEDPQNPGTCIPINVCAQVTCIQGGPGGIFCNMNGLCQCGNAGFALSAVAVGQPPSLGPCTDINECGLNPAVCDANSQICQNTIGSYSCSCRDGFESDPTTTERCLPIGNACITSPCDTSGPGIITCNSLGSNTFQCSCGSGFELVSQLVGPCNDLDECNIDGFTPCDVGSTTCQNAIGTFSCACRTGYTNIIGSATTCQDINECLISSGGCDVISTTCRNFNGGFSCDCLNGFTFGSANACINIDECNQQTDTCDLESTICVDNPGFFSCQCLPNFIRLTLNSCVDVCTAGQSTCDLTTTICVFSNGAVSCVCQNNLIEIPGNPNACQIADAQCCPLPLDINHEDNILQTTQGTCVFFDQSGFDTFDNFKMTKCNALAAAQGFTGGRLAEFADEPIGTDIPQIVVNQGGSQFPATVFVNFRRNQLTDNFVWDDGLNTVLPSNDGEWLPGSPTQGSGLDCGSIASSNNQFGYNNVDCTILGFAFCTVNTVPCTTPLTARALLPLMSINGDPATFTSEYEDSQSESYMEAKAIVVDLLEIAIPDKIVATLTSFQKGSIIAYVEVTVISPRSVTTYQQLKESILNFGETDENGIVSVTTSSGDTITFDSKRLSVDDRNNHICHASTCKNGGTCQYNNRLIDTNCQCMDGFGGTRCEAIMGESDTGLIIGLSIVMVTILLIFVSCFCCLCLFFNRKSQRKNQMIYQYRSPPTVSEVMRPRSTPIRHDHRRVAVNPSVCLNDGSIRFPSVIRNRGVEDDTELGEFARDNNAFYQDDRDVESSIDEKRLSHFERIFKNANTLNSHMSSRGDGASVVSGPISSTNSIYKQPLSEQFDRPYTADGTENI